MDDQILPGHNVAVPTDLDNEPFWLLLVTKSPHEVEVEFVDHYSNSWKPGDLLIRGYYYEWLQPGSRSYILRDDSPHAYILQHSTLVTKFQMPPTKHAVRGSYATYELTMTTMEKILDALEEMSLLD